MNRYAIVTEIVFTNLEQKCFGIKKIQGYQHLLGVATIIMILAKKRSLDCELSSCIGILHDYATYYNNTSFHHANHSSILATSLLEDTNLFSKQEIESIVHAINNHSNKEIIDDDYSELIKDADVYQQYLIDPSQIFSTAKQKRIDKVKKEIL